MNYYVYALCLLTMLLTSGCNGFKAAGTKALFTPAQNGDDPVIIVIPPPPQSVTFNFVNHRQCADVPQPAFWAVGNNTLQAQDPVLRIYSMNSNVTTPPYVVSAGFQRRILFEQPLLKDSYGRYPQIESREFTLHIDPDTYQEMVNEVSLGKALVTSFEERYIGSVGIYGHGFAVYGSSQGLPGHGNFGGGGLDPIMNPTTNSTTTTAASFQLGSFYRSGDGAQNANDPYCDGEGDPLVLNFSNTQFQTVSPSVWFPLESPIAGLFGWIAPNTQQAFLVLDRNGNGLVDDGQELFSNYVNLGGGVLAINGFEALKFYDRTNNGGNNDRKMDSRDAVFPMLKLWFDRNGDGRTDQGELVSLSSRVSSIELSYQTLVEDLEGRNKLYARSIFRSINGATLPVADLWFAK